MIGLPESRAGPGEWFSGVYYTQSGWPGVDKLDWEDGAGTGICSNFGKEIKDIIIE
jgi:hypothetical protein